MKNAIIIYVFSIFLASCASAPQIFNLSTNFDISEVAWFSKQGSATISGDSFWRQAGGGVVTCAGTKISLYPQSQYADERAKFLYGNNTKGFRGALHTNYQFIPDDSYDYHEARKTTICDATGKFEFLNLPSGQYYIASRVVWQVQSIWQGGSLMQKISLAENENKKISLSP